MQNTSQSGLPAPALTRLRGAATPHGPEYEFKLAGLLALRLRRRGLPFQVFTNVAAARPLDDIVLRVLGPTPTTVLIQLKHANATPAPPITPQAFSGARGDFALGKYFSAFAALRLEPRCFSLEEALWQECCEGEVRMVLYTNRPVTRRRPLDGPHQLLDIEDVLRTDGSRPSAVFSFGPSDAEVWRLFENESQKENYENEFLPCLRVFSQQAHSDDLDELIREELDAMFGGPLPRCEKLASDYTALLRAWALDDAQGCPLSESSGEIEGLLLQDLAKQGQSAAGGGVLVFAEGECAALRQLLASPGAAHVQVPGVPPGFRAAKLLQVLEENVAGRWAYVGDAALREFPPATLEAACGAGDVLVLDAEEELEKAGRLISATANTCKVVVVSSGRDDRGLGSCAPISTELVEDWYLHQLSLEAQTKILDRPIIFQGDEMPLRALETSWGTLREEVNGALLSALAEGRGGVALGAAPPVPPHADVFLPRTLQHPAAIDPSVIKELDPQIHQFALSGFRSNFLEALTAELRLGRYSRLHESYRWIILPSIEQAEADFWHKINNQDPHLIHRNVHWLHCIEGEEKSMKVIWMMTVGDEDDLEPYVLPATAACEKTRTCVHAPEDVQEMTAWGQRVGLLVGEPGIGKSRFLQRLAAESRARAPERWTILVQALHHGNLLQELPAPQDLTTEHVVKLLTAAAGVAGSAAGAAEAARRYIRAALEHTGAIAVFIDGVDEVCPFFKDKLVQLIKLLMEMQVKLLWVSTRPEVQVALRQALRCPATTLRPLSEEEQKSFLCQHWASACNRPLEELEGFATEMVAALRSAAGSYERSLLDIPLHAQMAAEAFATQTAQQLSAKDSLVDDREMTLLKLFRGFVEQKRSVYKVRFGLTHSKFKNLPFTDNFDEVHEHCAMLVLVSGGVYGNVDQQCFKDNFEKNREHLSKEKNGILWLGDEGMPQFLHYTYVEYFAASWLISHPELAPAKMVWRCLLEQDMDSGLRQMLERMLSEDLPLHRAVLEDKALEKVLEATSDPNQNDCFGRTALHLAVLLRRACAVDTLLDNGCDPGRRDSMMDWTALRYVSEQLQKFMIWTDEGRRHLLVAELLVKAGADPSDIRENKEAAFWAAKFGYSNVMISLINVGVSINSGRGSKTLLHTTAEEGHVNSVGVLLQHGADLHQRDCYERTALHFASKQGHSKIMHLLLDGSGDPNVKDKRNQTPLMLVAENGNATALRLLLQHGADLDQRDEDECSALHYASREGHCEIMQLLLERGADPNAKDMRKQTPLMIVAESGDETAVRLLLQHGADLHQHDEDECSALHFATEEGDCEIMQLLLEKGADPNAKDIHKQTPLMIVAKSGDETAVRLLLQHGADLHQHDEDECSVLHFATEEGHCEIVQLLLEEGADPNSKDMRKQTPLMLSAERGNAPAVKLLLQHGADLHQRDVNGCTALHFASRICHYAIMQLLLEGGADQNAENISKETPLMCAVGKGDASAVRLLLQHGADIHQRDEDESSVLHYASRHDIVKLLLERGGDPNAEDLEKLTPLMKVAGGGDASAVRLLLQHGADIHHHDEEGCTALYFPSLMGHCEIIQLLLEFGGDPNAKGKKKRTPLMCSAIRGHESAVRLLLKHGADLHQRDEDESTALHFASRNCNCEIMQLLLKGGADQNAETILKETPLMFAARNGGASAVRLLLQHVADLHQRDECERTSLLFATWEGHCEIMKLLIEWGGDPNAKDKWKKTPLILVAWMGDATAVRLLLQHGADLHQYDEDGCTALHFASKENHYTIMNLLLGGGGDPNAEDKWKKTALMSAAGSGDAIAVRLLLKHGADLHLKDENGYSALHYALKEGHCGIAKIFLEAGGDPNAEDKWKKTPLMLAAGSGNATAVHLLLQYGADLHRHDEDERTALDFASEEGHSEIMQLLLERGAKGKRKLPRILASMRDLFIAYSSSAQSIILNPLSEVAEMIRNF